MEGAMLAQALRMPGGGAGNVGDALKWFDDPHRPGVSDALVAPERAAGVPAQRGEQAWAAGRGMPSRPTPPQARRFEPGGGGSGSGGGGGGGGGGGSGGGGGAVRAAGYRPGQRLTPRAARDLQAEQPVGGRPNQLVRQELQGAAEHPNLDLRSFRDYLLQQPKAFSARDARGPTNDGPQPPLGGRGSLGEHASAEVMANLGQMYARLTTLEKSETSLQRTVAQQEQEIRAARYEVKDNAKQMQAIAQLEERLRRAEASESAANQRLRTLEENFGQREANNRERQTTLENELRDMQRVIAAAEQKLSDAAVQRRELHGDVEGVHDKLAERVEKYTTALNEQIQRSNEERLKLESSTKSLLHEVSTAVADKLRNVENLLLPELSRKTGEAVSGVHRKLDDGLAKLSTALRDVDQLRNQGDAMVRTEVGNVQELVQKGLLQLKAEAEKQKSTVATLVKAEIQNRMLNIDGIQTKLHEMRLDVANEHQAGLQQLSEVKAGVLEQVELVAAQGRAAMSTAVQARKEIGAEMATLRSEFEASDHGMMLEWRGMMDHQHATMVEKFKVLQSAVETESEERRKAVREVAASVIEAKDAVESCVAEWRDGIDAAETRWNKALQDAVTQLQTNAVQIQDGLREELQKLETDQKRIESSLQMKLQSIEIQADEKISANADSLVELSVRMEAVEQLLDEQASKLEAGVEDCKADAGAKVLALQEETAEHLSGFRDFLDTELNSIQDTTEKAHEELTAAIVQNRTELKEELTAGQSELEARVLAAGEALSSVLRDDLSSTHGQAAEEMKQWTEQGMQKVKESAQGLNDTVMSMRIRITAAEERARRVQTEMQSALNDVVSKLDALSTAAATSTDLAELRTRMETAQLEMINRKQMEQRSSTKAHASPGSENTLSDDVSEELSAHMLKLNDRVNAWEDKLREYQQTYRASATRLQERVQRCHGKFDETKAAVTKLEETSHLVFKRLEANDERMKQHEDRMSAQDTRVDAVDERFTRDEDRIDRLETIGSDTTKQMGNLVQRSGDLEEGARKSNEAIGAADVERALLAENIEKLRAQLDSTEKDMLAIDRRIDKNGQDDIGNQVQLQGLCDKNAARSDGLEKDLQRMEEALRALCDSNSSKSDGLEKNLTRVEQLLQEATGMGLKMTQLSIRVDNLDRLFQEDVGIHQRRFDDGTALARESVASKRRESKEKLDARIRRKSGRLTAAVS